MSSNRKLNIQKYSDYETLQKSPVKYSTQAKQKTINNVDTNRTPFRNQLDAVSEFGDIEREEAEEEAVRWPLLPSKRWSVIQKLNDRYDIDKGPQHICYDVMRRITSKCILATGMLVMFVAISIFFTRVILFNLDIGEIKYDFIIVGSGTAGSVVARRLLDEGASVLLLEAGNSTQYMLGGEDYFGTAISRFDVPLLWTMVSQQLSEYHWQGFRMQSINLFKGLGGESSQGAMLYLRALQSDIESWGLPSSWSWQAILSSYRALERYGSLSSVSEEASHAFSGNFADSMGRNGLIPVTESSCREDPVGDRFIAASESVGLQYMKGGFNGEGDRSGVGCFDASIKDGVRITPIASLLGQFIKKDLPFDTVIRSSTSSSSDLLTLKTNARVTKVILSKGSIVSSPYYQAVGVEYEMNHVTYYAYIGRQPLGSQINNENDLKDRLFDGRRSVILSAGAIMSPMILFNSGVGPGHLLKEANIPVVVNNDNIGSGLRNHVTVGLAYQMQPQLRAEYNSILSFASLWTSYIDAINAQSDQHFKTSQPPSSSSSSSSSSSPQSEPLPSSIPNQKYGLFGTNGISAGGYLSSPFAQLNNSADIQIVVYPTVQDPHYLSHIQRTHAVIDLTNCLLVTVTLLHPTARYKVVLDPLNPSRGGGGVPRVLSVVDNGQRAVDSSGGTTGSSTEDSETSTVIEEDIFSSALSDLDIRRIAWGIEQVRRIMDATPIREQIVREVSPGAVSSDGPQLGDWIRQNAFPQSNWMGSLSLGPSSSSSAAVDEQLRIHRVSGLRVVDSSVIPSSISAGDIQATVAAIAWRAVDFI